VTDHGERIGRPDEGQAAVQGAVLRGVIDHIPYRVFWKDRACRSLGCNVPFAQDAGLARPDEIVGLTDFDLPWSREEAESFRACDQRVMTTGEAELHIVEPQRRSDGSESWLETSKVPLRDAHGAIVGVLGTYLDITHQVRSKHELERARDEALRANRVKSDFIASVGREVRTPLLLPPYSPELNPVERLWAWVRQHELSNRVLPADEELDQLLGEVMLEIPPELIRSVCRCSWLERAA